MQNPVSYFEIPVLDLDRAISFYTAVFNWDFERVTIDGNEMALFPETKEASGISGALAKGESYIPGPQGARLYFGTHSIEETLMKASAAGGKLVYPKTAVADNVWVAEFEDSEGNCIALIEQ